MMDGPTLDEAVLARLRALNEEGEPDLVEEVLGLFLDDAPPRVEELVNAVAAGDAGQAARAAHALKGAAGNIGAGRVQAAAHRIEAAAKGGDLEEAAAALTLLRAEFDALIAEIARRLAA